jgi:hypothetical protein
VRHLPLLILLGAFVGDVGAQAYTPPAAASPERVATARPPAAAGLPDIEFAADVRMESIEFGSEPRAQVRFTGGPRLDTRHDVVRDALPTPVQPGRAYRGVTVRTTISAKLLEAAAEAAPVSPPTPEDTP